jgi:hypothetical protein
VNELNEESKNPKSRIGNGGRWGGGQFKFFAHHSVTCIYRELLVLSEGWHHNCLFLGSNFQRG